MAKQPTVTKTQAVRDYLKDHPGAMSKEIAAALNRQGITINPGHVANIKTVLNKAERTRKPAKTELPAAAAPAAAEKPARNGEPITLELIKKVARAVNLLGGMCRTTEVLDVIKEAGGMKKFKELAEAMSAPNIDDIPF